VIYVIIGILALQIAGAGLGDSGEEATKEGALRKIAERSFGTALLVALAIGLAGYVLWRLTEALWGKRDEDDDAKRSAKRLASGAKAVMYGVLLASTVRFIVNGETEGGGGQGGDQQEESLTARMLDLPMGQLLVGGVGAAILAASAYLVYRGLAQKFEKRLDTSEMGPVTGPVVGVLGTVGLVARGALFGVAGWVLIKAAIDFDPEAANGLDGTLRLIAAQTYGQVLLTVTAIGVIAYGLYSFAEARYRQL
jgi:hypothetical protein